jgi:hypothetical protein
VTWRREDGTPIVLRGTVGTRRGDQKYKFYENYPFCLIVFINLLEKTLNLAMLQCPSEYKIGLIPTWLKFV